MGRPEQADHESDAHQEEHQYEHPLESDITTGNDSSGEYPQGKANYHDPSAETNNMMNQQQQYPPAQNPAASQYPPPQQNQGINVNIPGVSFPPQAQQQPQIYQPQSGNYAPPPQYQQHQGPVQFPPTRPPPPVPISPSPLKPHQFNGSTTAGFPMQQQQTYQQGTPMQTFQPGTPNMVSSHMPKVNGTNGWSTGLFDCMEDPNNAFMTAVFPCLTFGQIAEIIDNGHTTCGTSGIMYGAIGFCIAMPCLLSCGYRTKLRNQFDLVEAPAPDWATHFLCEWCALCQEYRELKNRGLDPSIGWQGNQMRKNMQQQTPVMMAPMNQSMMQ